MAGEQDTTEVVAGAEGEAEGTLEQHANGTTQPDPVQVAAQQKEQEFRLAYDIPDGMPLEDYGRMLGWVPEEEYKGDPSKWRALPDFIEYGQKNRLVLKGEVGKLSKKVQERDQKINQLTADMLAMTEFINGTKKAIGERTKEQLLEQKKQAYSAQDFDAVVRIEEEIKKNDAAAAQPVQRQQVDPVFISWKSENSWYDEKPLLAVEADEIAKGLAMRGIKGKDLLDGVTKVITKRYPEEFDAPAPKPAVNGRGFSAVDSGGSSTLASRKPKNPTFANLPKDAQSAWENTMKRYGVDKEKYAAQYFKTYGDAQ